MKISVSTSVCLYNIKEIDSKYFLHISDDLLISTMCQQ